MREAGYWGVAISMHSCIVSVSHSVRQRHVIFGRSLGACPTYVGSFLSAIVVLVVAAKENADAPIAVARVVPIKASAVISINVWILMTENAPLFQVRGSEFEI